MLHDWLLEAYQFELPEELIAQTPADRRDHSRLMHLERNTKRRTHHHFYEIVDLLPADTALVLNNTKVLPARLLGQRASGGQLEALLVQEESPGLWRVLLKRAKRIKPGERLEFAQGQIVARATERGTDEAWRLQFESPETLSERLEQYGFPPLPPYIQREAPESTPSDRERYQTCYAQKLGAIAAPTAGLHFTPEILQHIRARGIPIIEVTLHVGLGTFTPIHAEDIRQHAMHSEYFEVSEENWRNLQVARTEGRRLVAIGTTSVRVLETLAQRGLQQASSGWTNAYLYPPYQYQWVRGLLTNFHLPGSTLLLLVAAFYGREPLLQAYRNAIEERYRFFSYGDCMLIL